MHRRLFLTLAVTALLFTSVARAAEPEDTLYLELDTGRVVIELLPNVAPAHVARIKELTREGFYNGVVFHRVIPGFMAQSGDPTGTGRGGSDRPDLPAEFSSLPFERGTVGAARTADPNSANSQWFITFGPTPHLNGDYTVWGRVIDGMEAVDAIAPGEPPVEPTQIIEARIAADVD